VEEFGNSLEYLRINAAMRSSPVPAGSHLLNLSLHGANNSRIIGKPREGSRGSLSLRIHRGSHSSEKEQIPFIFRFSIRQHRICVTLCLFISNVSLTPPQRYNCRATTLISFDCLVMERRAQDEIAETISPDATGVQSRNRFGRTPTLHRVKESFAMP